MFTYKTNTNGYLTKFKAHFCVQSNLQESVYKDIYATTLIARLFKALMAIIIIFDLDCWQGDAINVFINSLINKVIYIKYPNGFGVKDKYLLLYKALYRL